MMHLLGIDHPRLPVPSQGLDVRFAGVASAVVQDILA
jgi:hypothetical protein